MRSLTVTATLFSLLPSVLCSSGSNISQPLNERLILPSNFKPPQVFRNVNLLRTINLEKAYPRDTINVVIENVDKKPQGEYFLPFESALLEKVGAFEVRDKKTPEKGGFQVEVVEYDSRRLVDLALPPAQSISTLRYAIAKSTIAESPTQFYRISLPEPLKPSTQQTLSISYSILSSLHPVPAAISQTDKQYLVHMFSAYSPSAYLTLKQKTKVKFPGTEVKEYTILPKGTNTDGSEDPQKQGSTFTYGPYGELPAEAQEPVRVRYEFTKPLLHVSTLERDLEVSHWGGNLATEERYWTVNKAANLSGHFSRVTWQTTSYYKPATVAVSSLKMPLLVGSLNPYYTDEIGNVSTSRFRSGVREAHLELFPRYPIFGGWKYNFRVGWDADLNNFLRKLNAGDGYVLKVPFMEGPKQSEGIEYGKVEVRVILPEGARNVKYHTSVPLVSAEMSLHRTFMDTLGRTALKLTALNVVDDLRDADLIVTYDYPMIANLRKPLAISIGVISVFIAAWGIGQLDTSIGKRK
ncbi:MAG: dolichyl-diphosphooligosaccharide--protein glycosyltransferase subunit 1 [Trichoglossum hirsutum]|nr:MAG: dolichyl-diphosphooligosaccharide--protein glycosyltransferase subunit 1 [Trichoglossum hirsutum]